VLVEEFADFECPFCAPTHEGVVKPLLKQYGAVIRYEWKHFPLRTIHRYAMDAAEASECAADQGKFWEYVDLMFAEQDQLGYDALLDWADRLGLDVTTFERCWKSHTKRDTVLADYEEGRNRGVNGTPTFFVNGTEVPAGYDTLSAAIEEHLRQLQQRL
jgi:protein-disulfide isomerase